MKFKELPKEIQNKVIQFVIDREEEALEQNEEDFKPVTEREALKIIKQGNFDFIVEKDKYGQISWELVR